MGQVLTLSADVTRSFPCAGQRDRQVANHSLSPSPNPSPGREAVGPVERLEWRGRRRSRCTEVTKALKETGRPCSACKVPVTLASLG